MSRRFVWAFAIAVATLATAAHADLPAAGAKNAAAHTRDSKPAAAKASPSARRRVRPLGAASASADRSHAADSTQRRLTDIHIEGEIPVPQVLFVTASDQRRFIDLQHRRYLRSAAELGKATGLPARVQNGGAPAPRLSTAEPPSAAGSGGEP